MTQARDGSDRTRPQRARKDRLADPALLAYHSCRYRYGPKRQTLATARWLVARRAKLLPIDYFHVVFILPHALNTLVRDTPDCSTLSLSAPRRPLTTPLLTIPAAWAARWG